MTPTDLGLHEGVWARGLKRRVRLWHTRCALRSLASAAVAFGCAYVLITFASG